MDGREGAPHVGRHAGGVAAYIDGSPLLELLPHQGPLLPQLILHVGLLRVRGAREAGEEAHHALVREGPQLVLVDEVLPGMAAAEEEQRGADRLPALPERGALLQEAAERREPVPGPIMMIGVGGFSGRRKADPVSLTKA